MAQKITTINLGGVNCYLIQGENGNVLVDTGTKNKQALLNNTLQELGCSAENLKLILLTHGDIDHIENCAYLKETYQVPVGMHSIDAEMVRTGNMSVGRKKKPDKISFLGGLIITLGSVFSGPSKFESFSPDFFVDESFDLNPYGIKAKILHLPGHSAGSLGLLTEDGELICGDLLWNLRKPKAHFLIDDLEGFKNSIQKIKKKPVQKILPGHGKAFSPDEYFQSIPD